MPEIVSPKLVLALLAVVLLVVAVPVFSTYIHINSPLIGGDGSDHLGRSHAVQNGRYFYLDSVYSGENTWYPPLFSVLTVFLSNVSGISLDSLFIWLPIPITLLLGFSFYLVGRELVGEWAGILSAFLAMFFSGAGMNSISVAVPTNLAFALLGFYILFFLRSNTLASGVILGLIGLTHIHVFVTAILFTGVYWLLEARVPDKVALKIPKKLSIDLFIVLSTGVLISLLYFWMPVISIYSLHTPNAGATYLGELAANYPPFFSLIFGMTIGSVLFWLALPGLYLAVRDNATIPLALFLTSMIGRLHIYLTLPLMNWFFHAYKFGYIYDLSLVVLAGGSISLIAEKLETSRKNIVLFLLIVLMIFQYIPYSEHVKTDTWKPAEPYPEQYTDLAEWINANTKEGNVFLAHPYDSFAINSLTGRNMVVTEQGHSSPFVDWNKQADIASRGFAGDVTALKGVAYVVFSPQLQIDHKFFDSNYQKVYDKDGMIVYYLGGEQNE